MSRVAADKEVSQLINAARRQGFVVERRGSGHWSFKNPGVPGMVVMSGTGQSPNSWRRMIKMLTDLGFVP